MVLSSFANQTVKFVGFVELCNREQDEGVAGEEKNCLGILSAVRMHRNNQVLVDGQLWTVCKSC